MTKFQIKLNNMQLCIHTKLCLDIEQSEVQFMDGALYCLSIILH